MAHPRHTREPGYTVAAPVPGTTCGEQRSSTVTAENSIVIGIFIMMALLAAFFPVSVQADESPLWLLKGSEIEKRYLFTSLYTKHYDPEPDHNNDQNMLGFENEYENNRLWGLAMFDNSFGQESEYLYVGQKWRAFESDNWYYKVTGGLLHGYEEPHEDKIPLNDFGVAPVIIPSIGYRNKAFFAEFVQLGLSAGMVTVGVSF